MYTFEEAVGQFLRANLGRKVNALPCLVCYWPGSSGEQFWYLSDITASDEESAQNLVRLLERSFEKKPRDTVFYLGQCGDRDRSLGSFPVVAGVFGFLGRVPLVTHFAPEKCLAVMMARPYERTLTILNYSKRRPYVNLKLIPTTQFPVPIVDGDEFSDTRAVHRIYLAAAFALVEHQAKGSKQGHDIAAIVVASTGQIISYGNNHSYAGYLDHAERIAIEDWCEATQERYLPAKCQIYTTMMPCKLCAGTIISRKSFGGLKVYYGQMDPGKHALPSELDRLGLQVGLGDNEGAPLYLKALRGFVTDNYEKNNFSVENVKNYLDVNVKQPLTKNLPSYGSKFSEASNSLRRKVNKYNQDEWVSDRPKLAVVSALLHVVDFLQKLGISKFGGLALNNITELARLASIRHDEMEVDTNWENYDDPSRHLSGHDYEA